MRPPSALTIIGISMASGVVFATGAAIGAGEGESIAYAWVVGAIVGFVLSPAAAIALADSECRPSFGWVFWPTLAAASIPSVFSDAGVGFLSSVASYVTSAIVVGVVARLRRRRLSWHRAGRCSSCGYDMAGLEAQTCPECGCNGRVRPYVRVPPDVLRS